MVAILIAAAVWGRLLMSPLSWFADGFNKRRDYLFRAATVLFLLIGLMVIFHPYFSSFGYFLYFGPLLVE